MFSKLYRFHLHDDNGNVSWSCLDSGDMSSSSEYQHEIQWSSSVFIKGLENGEKDEIIISSSVKGLSSQFRNDVSCGEQRNGMKRLVQKPSRLSVCHDVLIYISLYTFHMNNSL